MNNKGAMRVQLMTFNSRIPDDELKELMAHPIADCGLRSGECGCRVGGANGICVAHSANCGNKTTPKSEPLKMGAGGVSLEGRGWDGRSYCLTEARDLRGIGGRFCSFCCR